MMEETIIKSHTWGKNRWKGGGGPSTGSGRHSCIATARLNPMMDDDYTLDVDDLDDEANVPTNTATPTIEMDGDGGENTTTDDITNTGV